MKGKAFSKSASSPWTSLSWVLDKHIDIKMHEVNSWIFQILPPFPWGSLTLPFWLEWCVLRATPLSLTHVPTFNPPEPAHRRFLLDSPCPSCWWCWQETQAGLSFPASIKQREQRALSPHITSALCPCSHCKLLGQPPLRTSSGNVWGGGEKDGMAFILSNSR